MGTPLRSPDQQGRPGLGEHGSADRDPTSNEALLLSALIASGTFNPGAYGLGPEHFIAWQKLYDFALDYQRIAGGSPPLALLKANFPSFESTVANIDVRWLANQLTQEHASRDLRLRGQSMARALGEDDLDGAFAALEGIARPRGFIAPPKSVFDHVIDEVINTAKIPTPWPSLNHSMGGGIDISETLYIQMRLGQGKSWIGTAIAAHAAWKGYKVAVASLEMPARQVTMRALTMMAGTDYRLQAQLHSPDPYESKKAIDEIREKIPGDIAVYDPTMVGLNTIPTITALIADHELVFVDHIGLMKGPDGRRAIEDWRVQATVSNVLRESVLAHETPMVAAVQANRAGEHTGTMAIPQPSEMAGADDLGRDATTIFAGKRLSKRVLKVGTTKVREGETKTFYLRFEPQKGRLSEMTKDAAYELSADDDSAGDTT